jgi:hypothetical protein
MNLHWDDLNIQVKGRETFMLSTEVTKQIMPPEVIHQEQKLMMKNIWQ